MRVAIDISPISESNHSQHSVRGVGFYIHRLKSALEAIKSEDTFLFVDSLNTLPKNIDLLHIPYFDPFFLHLPKLKQLPTVVTIHDLTPLRFPKHFPSGIKGGLKLSVQKFLVKQVEGIITDSDSSKQDILQMFHIPNKKIHTVYLAADDVFRQLQLSEKEKSEILEKYHLPKEFILYVGDVTWNKNLPNIIKACQKAEKELVLVGKAIADAEYDRNNPWNEGRNEVHKLLSHSKRIHVLGFIPTQDIVSLYNLAQLFLMPSRYEGFGLGILEAMASGCPVITSKNGSLPEVAGEACFYVDSESVESIANGITTLFQDKNKRSTYRLAGLKQASKFSWDKTAKETVAVYKSVK